MSCAGGCVGGLPSLLLLDMFLISVEKYCFQLLTMPLVISDLYVTLSLDGATSILVQDRVSASEI